MKRRILQTIVVLLAIACSATAQTLNVASIEATTGGQAELVVSGSGMAGVTALQFNLALPQGITLNESAIAVGEATSDHTLSIQTKENGEYLVVLYHLDLGLVSNGTLLRLPVTVGQQAGNFSGNLYTVRTANTAAESHECSTVGFNITVKAAAQPVTITADNKTMTYGDDIPTLTYQSSGATLNGTPKLSTTATKTSPVGTYPIKVEKGTVTNEQVTYVDGTLTIGKAPLTVGVQNVTITEGDAIPTFTLTYSGFRNNDTEANAFTTKPTATTTATSASKPGTYPITVSGGAAQNYALTYTQGTLTITAKPVQPVTITADNKTMTYGDDIPTLTYKSSGATLNGTPILSTTATKTSPVGTYPIKVEKGTVTNEQVTYVDGTLTIGKAPLTVGVQNVTITEGDAIPAFTLTYSGWRNNDSEANAFTTKPTATTTATSASKPGTYPITVSGGAAQNYALTYTQGTLTITAKPVQPVTITADNKTMTYGDDIPTLTYKSSGATLNGTPILSTTATRISPIGTYPIKVEKGTVTNEQVTYVDGTLTILQNTNDLTSRVGIAAADWQTTGLIDWAGPKIITRDGRETALAEVYETTTENTGTMMEQTVTGLKNGAYEVTVYANAFYTSGRGFDSNITDGQKNVAYVFANEAKTYIVAHIGESVSTHGEYTLNCNVTNGKLRMGLTAEKAGTNWHSIQIKSLDRIGEVSGIQQLSAGSSQDNRVYNLGGQRLTKPKKGINIVGGKKVFMP